MQVTETISDPLRREFTVVVDVRISTTSSRAKSRDAAQDPSEGVSPRQGAGLLPQENLSQVADGRDRQRDVNKSSEQVLKEKEIKPATTPRVDFVNALDNVIAGKADLEFTMKVDLMPDFTLANLSELKAERLVADVADEAVEEALKRLADSQKIYSDKGEGAVAEKGDVVTIDFKGKIDGEPSRAGREGFDLTLGSGAFIPGFEDQLIGAKAGDERNVKVKFPENYGAAKLAGKARNSPSR